MSSMSRFSSDSFTVDKQEIAVGDQLPTMYRSAGRIQTTVFCAAVRNFHQVHFDDAMCRRQGWKSVIVPGFLMGNWCMELVTATLGPYSIVRSVRFKMTAVAFVDCPILVVGEVTAIDNSDDRNLVTCKLRVVDEDDQVVTVATVTAEVPVRAA